MKYNLQLFFFSKDSQNYMKAFLKFLWLLRIAISQKEGLQHFPKNLGGGQLRNFNLIFKNLLINSKCTFSDTTLCDLQQYVL